MCKMTYRSRWFQRWRIIPAGRWRRVALCILLGQGLLGQFNGRHTWHKWVQCRRIENWRLTKRCWIERWWHLIQCIRLTVERIAGRTCERRRIELLLAVCWCSIAIGLRVEWRIRCKRIYVRLMAIAATGAARLNRRIQNVFTARNWRGTRLWTNARRTWWMRQMLVAGSRLCGNVWQRWIRRKWRGSILLRLETVGCHIVP